MLLKNKIFYIILFLLLCIPTVGYAQSDSLMQSSSRQKGVSVIVRYPKQKTLDKFNNDDNFRYEEEKAVAPGLIDRLIMWILRKIFGNVSYEETPSVTSIWNYIIIPLAILIILIAIIKLSGIKITGLFGRKSKNVDLTYLIDDEDVRASEFDELLAKALSDKNYRLAVRYLYLKTLQKLDEAQLIEWSPNKTNHSYINELTNRDLIPSFRDKVLLFELVWYGEYQIKEPEFDQIHNAFASFNQNVTQSASV